MTQMFVWNTPHAMCCGESIQNCKCGGNQTAKDTNFDEYEYSGRYSRHWTPEKEAERLREEQLVLNSRPTPIPDQPWIFRNEFACNEAAQQREAATQVVTNAQPRHEGLYAGQAFGEGGSIQNSDKPTPMVDEPWLFQNEFASNRR